MFSDFKDDFSQAQVAQKVEHRIEAPSVMGSIPIQAIKVIQLSRLEHTSDKREVTGSIPVITIKYAVLTEW